MSILRNSRVVFITRTDYFITINQKAGTEKSKKLKVV